MHRALQMVLLAALLAGCKTQSNSVEDHSERTIIDEALAHQKPHEVLAGIPSQLRQMTARQLLNSLKTLPSGAFFAQLPPDVYRVYRDGNFMIIHELASRPKSELESLRSFQDDTREVFTGDDGPPCSVGALVQNPSSYDMLK